MAGRAAFRVLAGLSVLLLLALVFFAAQAARARRALGDLRESLAIAAGPAVRPRPGPLRPPGAPRAAREPGGASLKGYAAEVNALLVQAQALGEFGADPRLAGACRLALAGGKRLRAAIVLELAQGPSAPAPTDAAEAALAVEYLHAASLVIDDLPAFDDDAFRRGGPSVHAAAGPAVAQMAAVALVAAAFQGFCRQADAAGDPLRAGVLGSRLCAVVARALGPLGAAGGQLLDSGGALPPGEVERVLAMKTASFFEVAFAAGWLAGGGDPRGTEALCGVGRSFGTAFQIADDIGDMQRDAARGAPANYANVHGRAAAVREVEACLAAAGEGLRARGAWGPFWENEAFPAVRQMALADAGAPPAPPGPAGRAPRPEGGPGEKAEPLPAASQPAPLRDAAEPLPVAPRLVSLRDGAAAPSPDAGPRPPSGEAAALRPQAAA